MQPNAHIGEALFRPEVNEKRRGDWRGSPLESAHVSRFVSMALGLCVLAAGSGLLTYQRVYEVTPIDLADQISCGRSILFAKVRQARPAPGRFGFSVRPILAIKLADGQTTHWTVHTISRKRAPEDRSLQTPFASAGSVGPIMQIEASLANSPSSTNSSLAPTGATGDESAHRPLAMEIIFEPLIGLLASSGQRQSLPETSACSQSERP